MSGRIYLIEPMCRGFEHAQFNAPFLLTVLDAYPDNPVTFVGHHSHIEHTRSLLSQKAPEEAGRVNWEEVSIPDRSFSVLKRMVWEARLLRRLCRTARKENAGAVIVTTGTDTALLAAKLLLWITRQQSPLVVILHSVLAGLEDFSKPFSAFRGISLALRFPNPGMLRILVPGRPILAYLAERFPRLTASVHALDHPSFWEQDAGVEITQDAPPTFGFFGVSAVKGFDLFASTAAGLLAEGYKAKFSMVGHLNKPGDDARMYPGVPDVSLIPLSQSEYRQRAHQISYAVWTTRFHRSGLVASSTFLDALSFVKPVIYLSNPLIDSYMRELGDIGYRCETAQELREQIRSLITAPPVERYRSQCTAIVKGRSLFDPHRLSQTLRGVIEECRRTR